MLYSNRGLEQSQLRLDSVYDAKIKIYCFIFMYFTAIFAAAV